MSIRLLGLTPVIGAAPGETVVGRVEIHNDGSTDAVVTVIVVGLATDPLDESAPNAALRIPVPAGSFVVGDIAITVPRSLGIGQHAAAFEATSDRPDERAVLTPFTVSIASVSRVELTPQPSTIRARRRADFHLDVVNNERQPVEVTLVGEAPDVDVAFSPSTLVLLPGQRAVSRGRLRGPRNLVGEPIQHNIVVTARGHASTTSVTAAYVQRPLLAHRLRMVVAGVTVVALWLAAIGGAALWLSNRDDPDSEAQAELVGVDTDGDGIVDAFFLADGTPVTGSDTDGDGIPDLFVDADGNVIVGLDTDGDGIPDAIVDADGNEVAAVDTNGDGVPDALSDGSTDLSGDEVTAPPVETTTILRGTVETDGDPTTVAVTLTAIDLGTDPVEAAPTAFRGAVSELPGGKLWPARMATLADLAPTIRRTVAIAPVQTQPGSNGVFLLTDVVRGQSYEVAFQQPGFDTQSFIVTPPREGDALELDIVMVPSKGSLGGRVVGPAGGLSGAQIVVTDGSLTFETTSTEGGQWSLEGVSTPAVYTVSAALRGFGTAVRQVELDAGETANGVDLQMVPGLGTMTGRVVDANGVGLGGATVTASNGETTLTTSTLTDGNVGFFSLPQLQIPNTYTVSAVLDGYVTQTRRVPLSGSADGIDFAMTSTTSRLSGQVLSSGGGPIANAGLTIATGELEFRATTSDSGVFSVDRLPPGNYTVLVQHFQHESATEFVTLQAGVEPTPLRVTLIATSGPPAIGTGSLAVSVINDDPLVNPPGISGATVTISRNRSTDAPRVITDATSPNVVFENLPIGTYTIRVTAPLFNPSPPITKSIGFALERVEVQLQKLGQASGTVVDSLTKTPLTNYFVSIYEIRAGGDVFIERVREIGGAWQSSPDKLRTGTYRIEVSDTDAPPGYLVRGDQILEPATGRPMTFIVPVVTAATVEPVVVIPIEADAYPNISGRVYKPRLDGETVEFDAIDSPGLVVNAECNGTDVAVALSDQFGNRGSDQLDTFSIDFVEVAAAIRQTSTPGACTLTVDDFDVPNDPATPVRLRETETYTLTNVVPNNGVVTSDRRVGVALAKPAPQISGQVFWIDPGPTPDRRIELPGVVVSSTSDPIVGFVPAESTTSDPLPGLRRLPISTTSSSTTPTVGAWTLEGVDPGPPSTPVRQIFGTTTYQYVTPNFGIGLVPVSVDDSGTATVPSSAPTSAVVTSTVTGYDVELRPPAPGVVRGSVTIKTIRSNPDFAGVTVTGTAPDASTRTTTPAIAGACPVPTAACRPYEFADAPAGSWSVAFSTPPNHQLVTPLGEAPTVVAPGQQADPRVDAEFVELGTIRVNLVDGSTSTPTPITETAGFTLSGFSSVSRPTLSPTAGTYVIDGVPVSLTNPTGLPGAPYSLAVSLRGYDIAGATVNGSPIGATAIPVSMRAGEVVTLTIELEQFGTITGSLLGQTGTPTPEPLSFTATTNPATLTVVRVDRFGTVLADEPEAETVERRADGTFSISGEPGYYKLTPAHPQYQATPAVIPPDTFPVPFPEPPLPPNVFEMRNATPNALTPYELRLRPGSIRLSAVTDLASLTAVAAAYDYQAGPCNGFTGSPPPDSAPVPTAGVTLTDFAPGQYCFALNVFSGSTRTAFPAIFEIVVPRGTESDPAVTNIVAPLPPLNPTVSGTLVAQNGSIPPGTVELVATGTVRLTSRYTDPGNLVKVNGADVANQANGNGEAIAVAPVSAEVYTWTYDFSAIPAGVNEITPPVIEGYTTPAVRQVTVPTMGPLVVAPFVYTATAAPAEFDIGPGDFPSLTNPPTPNDPPILTLTVNGSDPVVRYTAFTLERNAEGRNILVMPNVLPDTRKFTLTFDDALHQPVNDDRVQIKPKVGANGRRDGGTISTTADKGRITGTLTQFNSASGSGALAAGATIELLSGATAVQTITTTGPTPTYSFDAPAGNYVVEVTLSGFTQATLPVTITNGSVNVNGNIRIDKLATVTVTIANPTLPPGTTVVLVQTDLSEISLTQSSPPDGKVFSASVVAGTYRYLEARAPSYISQRFPAGPTPTLLLAIGTVDERQLTLTPRTITVVPQNNAAPPVGITNATVTVTVGGVTPATDSTSPYTFSSTDTAPAIPVSGTGTALVSAPGYRTRTAPIGNLTAETVPVALQPVVSATGTITAPNATAAEQVIWAESGSVRLYGSITGNVYTIAGLTNAADGGSTSWTIKYDKLGQGTGQTGPYVVGATTATPPATTTITVSPTLIPVTFTVSSDVPSGGLSGAKVTIAGVESAPTVANGTVTVNVAENANRSWTAAKSGFVTSVAKTLPAFTSRNAVPASADTSVTLVSRLLTLEVDNNDGTPAAAADVEFSCPTSAPCGTLPANGETDADGNFGFEPPLAAGTYTIAVRSAAPTKTRSTSVTVAVTGGTGSISTNPLVLPA